MFTKILTWFLILIGAIAVSIALFFFSMRFHDGPMEIIAGALGLETQLGLEVIRSGETGEGARRFASGAGRHGSFE